MFENQYIIFIFFCADSRPLKINEKLPNRLKLPDVAFFNQNIRYDKGNTPTSISNAKEAMRLHWVWSY